MSLYADSHGASVKLKSTVGIIGNSLGEDSSVSGILSDEEGAVRVHQKRAAVAAVFPGRNLKGQDAVKGIEGTGIAVKRINGLGSVL